MRPKKFPVGFLGRLPLLLFAVTVISVLLVLGQALEAQATPQGGQWFIWGQNNTGQLGIGPLGNQTRPRALPAPPVALPAEAEWETFFPGGTFTIGRTTDGEFFSWGSNSQGQLGLGHVGGSHNTPQPLPAPPSGGSWNTFHVGGSFCIGRASNGNVYVWGTNSHGMLGVGIAESTMDRSAAPLLLSPPAGSGTWSDFSARSNNTFALTSSGTIYAWGHNIFGCLGVGTQGVAMSLATPTPILLPPSGGQWNWNYFRVGTSAHHRAIRSSAGEWYIWGQNTSGQLGLGHFLGHNATFTGAPTTSIGTPQPLPNPPTGGTWSAIHTKPGITFGRTSAGEFFSWGNNVNGQLGIGVTGGGNRHTPQPMLSPPSGGTWNLEHFFTGSGQNFTVARSTNGILYSWGTGSNGTLGIGSSAHHNAPQLIAPPNADLVWCTQTNVYTGWSWTIALAVPREVPPEAILTKTLQTPEGTNIPNPMSFAFGFVEVQQRLSDDPVIYSISAANVPSIANQPVTLDMTTLSTAAGITTVTGQLDLWVLIDALTLSSGGVYVWEVYEVDGSSITASPLYVRYSEARFQIRAHANRYGELAHIEIFELNPGATEGSFVVGEKVEGMNFINILKSLTCLEVKKYVEGDYANLNTLFDFTVTLTGHDLTSLPTTITAGIVDADGDPVPAPRGVVTITGGTGTFQLMHGETLRIPSLPAGTTAVVYEAAAPVFIAEYEAISGGTYSSSYENSGPNTSLTTDSILIVGEGRNAAYFTNVHVPVPPTGLLITSAPWLALVAAALLLALIAANRKRRSIEEMPIIY